VVKWSEVLDEIDKALIYFRSEGVKPRLRTLFYYLYSKGLIPGTRSAYKTLSRKLVQARKRGRYRWDFIEDSDRVVIGSLNDNRFDDDILEDFKERLEDRLEELDIDRMLEETFDYLQPTISVGKWAEQPIVPEIWIEKAALASTINSWVRKWRIPIRVNRGYPSWTFIYNNVRSLLSTLLKHDKVLILYLGDLDYSGKDIERFIKEALEYFNLPLEKVEIKKLAVTPEQVEKFNLPPRPEDIETLTKLSKDPRRKTYENEMKYIVELDALVAYAPREFKDLCQRAIKEVWDEEIYNSLRDKAEEMKEEAEEMLEDVKRRAREKILEMIRGEI